MVSLSLKDLLLLVHPLLHKTTIQIKPLQAEHSLMKRKPFFSYKTDRNPLFNTTDKWRPTFLKDISQDQNWNILQWLLTIYYKLNIGLHFLSHNTSLVTFDLFEEYIAVSLSRV